MALSNSINITSDGRLQVLINDDGSFDVQGILEAIVVAGFAPAVYSVCEDVLKEAVNRTPILTGLLRSTGNVKLDGSPNDLMRMQLASSLARRPKKNTTVSPGAVSVSFRESKRAVGLKALYAMARSGGKSFTFRIGFHTSYARFIHEGGDPALGRTWSSLGPKSQKANTKKVKGKPGRYAGKVGKGYLRRAWRDNEAKYIQFLRSEFK